MFTRLLCKSKDMRWNGKTTWLILLAIAAGITLLALGIRREDEFLSAVGFIPLGVGVLYAAIRFWRRLWEQ